VQTSSGKMGRPSSHTQGLSDHNAGPDKRLHHETAGMTKHNWWPIFKVQSAINHPHFLMWALIALSSKRNEY